MSMIKIESNTLEEAYAEAARELECSVTELYVEVVQHPKSGLLGLFGKKAIIVATCKTFQSSPSPLQQPPAETAVAEESFAEQKSSETVPTMQFEEDEEYEADTYADERQIVEEVAQELNALFAHLCFDIDEIKVSMYDENTLYVEFNGEDAALLIGKEGYRYKALSYMIFNWINSRYQLQLRLEIAEFLANQEEAIRKYVDIVCEHVERDGRAQTKPLDGVLVQIALKELRERYPHKYVAIRTMRDGSKFILINDYNY